jgi:hypothetical protein
MQHQPIEQIMQHQHQMQSEYQQSKVGWYDNGHKMNEIAPLNFCHANVIFATMKRFKLSRFEDRYDNENTWFCRLGLITITQSLRFVHIVEPFT